MITNTFITTTTLLFFLSTLTLTQSSFLVRQSKTTTTTTTSTSTSTFRLPSITSQTVVNHHHHHHHHHRPHQTSRRSKSTQLQFKLASVLIDDIRDTITSWTNQLPFSIGEGVGRGTRRNNNDNGEEILKSLQLESDTTPTKYRLQTGQFLDIVSASLPFIFRAGSGVFAEGYQLSLVPRNETEYSALSFGTYGQIRETGYTPTPTRNRLLSSSTTTTNTITTPITTIPTTGSIVLYDLESCPYCRVVREAISILSLEVEYRPCPQNGNNRREILETYGDGVSLPILKDENTGVLLFEPNEIIRYLFRFYGRDDNAPSSLVVGDDTGGLTTTLTTSQLGLFLRRKQGEKRLPSNPPRLPLVLWAYESSPFCKLVREELCGLEIVHRQISCPRGSEKNRQRLYEKTGRFQVPYLEDPNNGVGLFESKAIVEYLRKVYGVGPSPVQYL